MTAQIINKFFADFFPRIAGVLGLIEQPFVLFSY